MKRLLWLLSIFFIILDFLGAGYVLYTKGQANAGHAVIPMLLFFICYSGYNALKKKEKNKELK